MAENYNLLKKGIQTRVYNGKDTLFWRDRWVGNSPLLNTAISNPSLPDSYRCVEDYWKPGLGWMWNSLHGFLPSHTLRRLSTMLIRSDDEGKDSMCWGLTSNGKFSISSAYDALMPPSLDDPDSTWNLIWKLYIPPKIHHFLRLVYHEKILNNMERTQRRINENPTCHHCPGDCEDLNHIFRKCIKVIPFWRRAANVVEMDAWTSLPFKDWMPWNLKLKVRVNRGFWKETFAVCLRLIWKWRNDIVFNGKEAGKPLKEDNYGEILYPRVLGSTFKWRQI